MAKLRAGSTARSAAAAAARASPAPTSSDPNLPTPTSTPRADLSSSGAKFAVASANRSSVGSSSSASATDLPAPAARDVASIAKEVGKRLSYDDEDCSAFPTAASALQPDPALEVPAVLAPLLELPGPDQVSSTTVVPASADSTVTDVVPASADSTVTQTQVAAPADSTAAVAAADAEGPVLTGMELVLAELRHARGLTPRSKRLLAALAEAASAELSHDPTAAALRTRRAAFWSKVRVGILAAAVFSVAAMDVALAVALYGASRGSHHHLVLPPT
ncbi:uncharacterized protein [Lolium perenne]|uniref:uncharacterized protein n=1 Tax=Lolium perenne TaxID=4522 RepID=UPI0021F65C0C|nr:uncharacterized protein LOC127305274 [Lolium perenne]